MIVYLDASALVKRYVEEPGSRDVEELIATATLLGTAVVTMAEVAAALGRAARRGILERRQAESCLRAFRLDWERLNRFLITDPVAALAAELAWEHGLRGYDAIHLACALGWQRLLAAPVVVATYDRELATAAGRCGLKVWPEG